MLLISVTIYRHPPKPNRTEPQHWTYLYNNSLSMRTDLITFIVLSILARLNGIHNYVIFRSKVQYVARFDVMKYFNILYSNVNIDYFCRKIILSLRIFFRNYFLLCFLQWEHYFVVKYLYIEYTTYKAMRSGCQLFQLHKH